MSNVGRDLASSVALDDRGARVTLGSLWADRRAVVAMIRYFDSASCRKLVAAMRDAQLEIESRGARVVVIGAAAADAVPELRESVGYQGPLLLASLDVFRAARMLGTAVRGSAKTARATSAGSEALGFFGKVRAVMNADVGKLLRMDVGEAMRTDLVKLGRKAQEPQAGSTPSSAVAPPSGGATTSHESGLFVVGPGAVTSFEWRAKGAGELPKLSELFAAVPAIS